MTGHGKLRRARIWPRRDGGVRPAQGRSESVGPPRDRFLARSSRGSCSSAFAPLVARTLGSRATADVVDPELGGSWGDASVLLAAEDDTCGAVAAEEDVCSAVSTPRVPLGPILATTGDIFIVLAVETRGSPWPCLLRLLPSRSRAARLGSVRSPQPCLLRSLPSRSRAAALHLESGSTPTFRIIYNLVRDRLLLCP